MSLKRAVVFPVKSKKRRVCFSICTKNISLLLFSVRFSLSFSRVHSPQKYLSIQLTNQSTSSRSSNHKCLRVEFQITTVTHLCATCGRESGESAREIYYVYIFGDKHNSIIRILIEESNTHKRVELNNTFISVHRSRRPSRKRSHTFGLSIIYIRKLLAAFSQFA